MGTEAAHVEIKASVVQPNDGHLSLPCAYGLRSGVLSSLETLAQSVSALAPTATPAILIPLVFASAGNGTWLSYLLATLGVMFVGACINQFASRSASPGSIYSYVAIGLGPGMGLLAGWLLLCAYVVGLSCVESQFTLYAGVLIKEALHLPVEPVVLMLICVGAAGYIAWRDIKLSSSLMLILEVCSISLILILMAITIWHKGYILDWSQVKLSGVSAKSLSMGLAFAIFGFAGFESAASLGSEARNPLKNIPKAIICSGLWSGLFYAVCAYVMILGFSGSAEHLEKCGTPLVNLAAIDGVAYLGLVLSFGAVISFFACTISCINVASRLMFMMGHHGLFHSRFSRAHTNNRTPHIAVIIATILGALPAMLLTLLRCSLMDIIAWTGSISAYAIIFSYALVSIAAPVYLHRLKNLTWRDLLIAVSAFCMMAIALIGNVDPNATGIPKCLPYVFGGLVCIGLGWYFVLKVAAPATVRLMTADMESIANRFIKLGQYR